MEECTHDCSSCSQNCSEKKPESLIEAPHALSKIGKVIAVISGKGGVGKSLVTALMAVTMRRKGYASAVLDADITGPSIPQAFGLHQQVYGDDNGIYPAFSKTGIPVMSVNLLLEKETDPVVWRGPIIAGTVKQFWTEVIWGEVDYMFVDMPPGTGDVPLTVFQSIPVDGIILVTTPQELVGMIVEKAAKMAEMMNVPLLGLVTNNAYFVCPNCGKKHYIFGKSNAEELCKEHNIKANCEIPTEPKLAAACDAGMIELFEGSWLDKMADMLAEQK